MRWLLFLSRLAFICGIFFLLSLSQLLWGWMSEGSLVSTVITIGVFMGSIIVPITCSCYFVLAVFRKRFAHVVPFWLVIANILFLFILIFFIFYWNDPYYNKA